MGYALVGIFSHNMFHGFLCESRLMNALEFQAAP